MRLRKDFFWGGSPLKNINPDQISDFYFDEPENRRIFDRLAEKCYLPTNEIVLEENKAAPGFRAPLQGGLQLHGDLSRSV